MHRTLALLVLAACSSAGAPAASSSSVAPAVTSASPRTSASPAGAPTDAVGAPADVGPDVLHKVCHAEHADRTSTLFFAKDASGKVTRIVVTPSRSIADMGNLIFDRDGKHLGGATGGEFPFNDKALADKERARVAALMGGADVPNDVKPLGCDAID